MFELYKLSMKEGYDDVKVFNEEIIIDIYNKICEINFHEYIKVFIPIELKNNTPF
jgi:hypothetical protein